MLFYYVSDGKAAGRYCSTIEGAHAEAKGDNYDRRVVTIEAVEIANDKANMLRLLNNEGGYEQAVGRKWELTPRGGLTPYTED